MKKKMNLNNKKKNKSKLRRHYKDVVCFTGEQFSSIRISSRVRMCRKIITVYSDNTEAMRGKKMERLIVKHGDKYTNHEALNFLRHDDKTPRRTT
jgi:hypothetical protein